jgi:predicted RNA-binding protein with RPS1 domain
LLKIKVRLWIGCESRFRTLDSRDIEDEDSRLLLSVRELEKIGQKKKKKNEEEEANPAYNFQTIDVR